MDIVRIINQGFPVLLQSRVGLGLLMVAPWPDCFAQCCSRVQREPTSHSGLPSPPAPHGKARFRNCCGQAWAGASSTASRHASYASSSRPCARRASPKLFRAQPSSGSGGWLPSRTKSRHPACLRRPVHCPADCAFRHRRVQLNGFPVLHNGGVRLPSRPQRVGQRQMRLRVFAASLDSFAVFGDGRVQFGLFPAATLRGTAGFPAGTLGFGAWLPPDGQRME